MPLAKPRRQATSQRVKARVPMRLVKHCHIALRWLAAAVAVHPEKRRPSD